MLDFKLLNTFYDVDITLKYPDYRHTYYHCREHLIARYNKAEDRYNITLEERDNILLNNEYPKEIMDILMIEIGNSIYPIEIEATSEWEVLKIKNYKEIKQQWIDKTQELLKKYETLPFKRYVEITSRNINNESKFRETLEKNTFMKLVLKPLNAESFKFSFDDFPQKGTTVLYECKKQYSKDSGIVTEYVPELVSPTDFKGGGYVRYTFSELNDIEKIEAQFDLESQDGESCSKLITIETDKQKRILSHKNSFLKRMFE